jgi:hypothetical protein
MGRKERSCNAANSCEGDSSRHGIGHFRLAGSRGIFELAIRTDWVREELVSLTGRVVAIRISKPTMKALAGVLAQLVERLNGIEEVTGSNPVGSTFFLLGKSNQLAF